MKLHNKDTGEDGRLMMCHDYDEYPFYIEIGSIKIYYHNFAEMVKAGWDCIKIPTEPLIKDEKIRNAVRAWAETNHSKFIIRNGNYTASDNRGLMIEFNKSWTTYMENGKQYTITELCGEEEE